jgi:hypothetical protein
MNSDSDERPEGSYSPTILCAQAMGREALLQQVVFCVLSARGTNLDGAIYKSSRVSQGSGGEGAPAQLGIEVLQHLWDLFALKRK